MHGYAQAIEEALADPDPWHGLCAGIERGSRMQADDRGLADVLTGDVSNRQGLPGRTRPLRRGANRAAGAGKTTGRLWADSAHQDVPLILMAKAGVVTAFRDTAPEAWWRLVGYLIQAFAAEAARPLSDSPAKPQVYQALMLLPETPQQ